jgi:hypothetical protein
MDVVGLEHFDYRDSNSNGSKEQEDHTMSQVQDQKFYERLASLIDQHQECTRRGNTLWAQISGEQIRYLWDRMPSGSGVDSGCKLQLDVSSGERIVFRMDYHHMNEGGMYDGWTEHTVRVEGSLQFGCRVHIGGRNRNDIKDYLHCLVWDVMTGHIGPTTSAGLRDIAERLKAESEGRVWVRTEDLVKEASDARGQ